MQYMLLLLQSKYSVGIGNRKTKWVGLTMGVWRSSFTATPLEYDFLHVNMSIAPRVLCFCVHKYTLWYRKCIGDQWNRLTPRERAEKEAFIAGEKGVIRGYMRMVCS